ncbi:MAG: octaprenyl diphosphate synthase [Dehalococcoidia bacterium]|nr:octaprenyl diphosphate synthase [Dehalococcoidia bacterium]
MNAEKSLIEEVRSLLQMDWQEMNREIRVQLDTDVGLINSISHYIINSGGKRLRPLMVLLSSRACGIDQHNRSRILAAAMIEFIHTATLLHDDVVDASDTRRGVKTAHRNFGNESTILVGDFLYSRAFQMMVQIGQMRVMEIMANTTNTIAEGEVLQLIHCGNPDITETEYMDVIYRKTGKLFEAGVSIGAVLADQSQIVESSLTEYGRHLGIAFQLIDDIFDYSSSVEIMGKNIGDDLAEGKPTLPLIYALERCNSQEQLMIREAIENKNSKDSEQIIECIKSCGALALATEKAKATSEKAIKALEGLPESQYKDALIKLARFSTDRTN